MMSELIEFRKGSSDSSARMDKISNEKEEISLQNM
jgi:hypothetical protein